MEVHRAARIAVPAGATRDGQHGVARDEERALHDDLAAIDLGGVDYITKPFNPVELAPLVRGLLERLERGERDELRREKLTELRALMAET